MTNFAPRSVELGVRPTAADPAEQPNKPPSLSPTPQPRTGSCSKKDSTVPHILIVDDNVLNRRLLAAFMQKNNLRYQEVTNGLEALHKYQAATHNIQVILMDMSMPVMDGMTATRAIREHEQNNNMPRSCIIALTGLTSSSARLEAWSSGIDHYVTKPVNYRELRELLKSEEDKKSGDQRDAGFLRSIPEEAS
jgi:CheY-like chemotaxis protein